MKFLHLALASVLLFLTCSCASSTDFYLDGKRVAHFSGDMSGSKYVMNSHGTTITWEAPVVNHSAATAAYGKSGSDSIASMGAVVTALSSIFLLLP